MRLTVVIDGKAYTRKVKRSHVYYGLNFHEKLPVFTVNGTAYVVLTKNGEPTGFLNLETYVKQEKHRILPE